MTRSIPSIDFRLATSASEAERQQFVREVGDALKDIGFFALTHHGIARSLIDETYAQCDAFFDLDEPTKRLYLQLRYRPPTYTAFGVEHAKDNPAPDLKEFWQTGRAYPEDGTTPTYPQNVWPTAHVEGFQSITEALFSGMESLAQHLLAACSEYLGKPREWLPEMSERRQHHHADDPLSPT